jgi:hypothetical protein
MNLDGTFNGDGTPTCVHHIDAAAVAAYSDTKRLVVGTPGHGALNHAEARRMANQHCRETEELWQRLEREVQRTPLVVVETASLRYQSNGRDSRRTHRQTAIPLSETAKPENWRCVSAVQWELLGWALLFLSIGVAVGLLL